jgi:pyruvate formate lyase activating enzyme
VGYGVAILYEAATSNPAPAATAGPEDEFIAHFTQLPRVARSAVTAKLHGGPSEPPFRAQGCLAQPGAVFVTVTNAAGDLRGCRGVTAPIEKDIVRETWHSAVTAALHDSRFPAVTATELAQLRFSVTVLGPVEAVSSPGELDPGVYGVIVSSNDGRKGVLLPAIDGIDSVEQQLAIARRKARIAADEPVRLERFTAHRYAESPARPEETTNRRAADPRIATHPARWWVMRQDGRLECQLCPRYCKLQPGQRGFCFVRQRLGDELVLTTYGRSSGFYIDPIEKKPLNHFLPGTSVLSFGTAGCNLGCRFCQNWHISKARKFDRLANAASPEMIASAAQRLACRSVAFTYNDPVIFAEYALDVAHECHARNIKTVAVTAGYITETARAEFFRGMDAANVDLKGFSERFYQRLCYGRLQPVLDTLEYLHQATDVWLEVTTLLIPGQNDSDEELHQAAEWFAAHLGPDVPWHFTAFHPDFKMRNTPPTPTATLLRAREIARSKGLRYVYTGNVRQPEGGSTWCPSCAALLIERQGFELATYALDDNRCTACGHPIAGHFEHQPGHWGARCQPVRVSA